MTVHHTRTTRFGRSSFSGLRRNVSRVLFLLVLSCFMAASLSFAQDRRQFNILIIFSEHTASEIRTDLTGAFFNELANLGIMFESELVELDSLHQLNQTAWDEKLSEKKDAIEAGKYKLIVTFGEPASNTLKNILPSVPESTAIILSNMKTFPEEWRQRECSKDGCAAGKRANFLYCEQSGI